MENDKISYRIIKHNMTKTSSLPDKSKNLLHAYKDELKIAPIRTSTMKFPHEDFSKENIPLSYPVLRRPFPVTSKLLHQKLKFPLESSSENTSDASSFPSDISLSSGNNSLGGSVSSIDCKTPPSIGRKRKAESGSQNGDAKQSKNLDCVVGKRPRLVPMGAGVKQHPRYKKINLETSEKQKDALGPVCQIPLPAMFSYLPPPQKLLHEKISVETQTSPQINSPCNRSRTLSKSDSRRNSGANVLNSLKKTIGNIRRAMSAERLNQVGNEAPQESSSPESDRLSPIQSQYRRVLISPLKFRRSRLQKSTPSSSSTPGLKQPRRVLAQRQRQANASGLSWNVEHKFLDGSYSVRLSRKDINVPFGFSIARDSEGIYISRLGGVRAVVSYWNLFQVGDRILRVQDQQCSKWDVAKVQSSIENELNVNFLVSPLDVKR